MSKNSAKQNIEQLMQWLPTLKSKRKKRVESRDTKQRQTQRR